MNQFFLIQAAVTLCLSIAGTSYAEGATLYDLTITNGSQMPISPAAIYTKNDGESAVPVGSMPTSGFIQLCQTGNVAARVKELGMNSSVTFITQANGPIFPGESRTVEIEVKNPVRQSIHFEAMYGKSKDACAVGSLNSHSLVALKQHVTIEIIQKDNVLLTGTFSDPVLPEGMSYLDPNLCPTATNAVSCLRELASPIMGRTQVRFFTGYSPSLISALEMKYGSPDVQTLLIPTSGAIQLKLKLKH